MPDRTDAAEKISASEQTEALDPNVGTGTPDTAPWESVPGELVSLGGSESKPGYRTTEFAVALGSIALIVLDVIPLAERVEGKYAAFIAIGYAVARGLAKAGVPHSDEG